MAKRGIPSAVLNNYIYCERSGKYCLILFIYYYKTMFEEFIQLPVDLMFDQPLGWLQMSLPIMAAAASSIFELTRKTKNRSFSLSKARDLFVHQHWFEFTGVEPKDTHFSIVIPVHNEESLLPSFLGALLASEVPSTVDMQVIFVINGSSDKSTELIRNRLSYINHLTELTLPHSIYDIERSNIGYQVRQKRIQFLVVETPTAGKANALNIGNEIAMQYSHPIAINIDANNWVEPGAIALMYRWAKQAIVDSPESNVVIVNANEFCPMKDSQVQTFAREKTQKAEVTGWMFAWSTQWIFENHGFLQYAIEDYGAGLLALSQGKKIGQSEANVWGYSAGNFLDENREMFRFIYGAMQLAKHFENHPVATQILLEDFPYLRPVNRRLEYHLSRRQKTNNPAIILRGLLRWLLNELIIFLARQKLHYYPHGQTWQPIRSTK